MRRTLTDKDENETTHVVNLALFVLLLQLLVLLVFLNGSLQLLLLLPQTLQQLAARPRLHQLPGIHKLPSLRGGT